MNAGKQFEIDFKNSLPNCYFFKPPDFTLAGEESKKRFTPQNPWDIHICMKGRPFYFELKSSGDSSMGFERKPKERRMIKYHQIKELYTAAVEGGAVAGFLLNFRRMEHTYFVEIQRFVNYIKTIQKNSINEKDIVIMQGVYIPCTKRKVHFRYDLTALWEVSPY